jgi:hypothetical protein
LATERRVSGERAVSGVVRPSAVLASPLTLFALFVLAVSIRTLVTSRIVAPWIMTDELTYSELARGLAESGRLLIRDESTAVYSVLYPLVISPAWFVGSAGTSYAIAKAINVVLISLTAVPVYWWGRRLMPSSYALLSACLVLTMPALLYAGTLMTENAFMPVFVLAAFAFALCLECPTLLRQGLALVGVAAAAAVRIQGLLLLVVLFTSILVMAVLEARARGWPAATRRALRFWPTTALVAGGLAMYAIVTAAEGAPIWRGLGAYRAAGEAHYSAESAARWVGYHFGELGLALGVLPVYAFIVLFASALRPRAVFSRADAAFLAVTASSLVWFPLVSGVFASRWAERVEERTMIYVGPLLLIAFATWLARGLPRPRWASAAAVAVVVVLVLILPLGRLLNHSILSDTFGLVPFLSLRQEAGMWTVHALLWAALLLLTLSFLFLPKRVARTALPSVLAVMFLASSVVIERQMESEALAVRSIAAVGDDVEWVDDEVGRHADAAFLVPPTVQRGAVWQTEFWNRSVRRVVTLDHDEGVGLPVVRASLARDGGIPTGTAPPYVVVPAGLVPAGTEVAEQGPWRLYRVDSPFRLVSAVEGVDPDGWMGRTAHYTVYRPPFGATLDITLTRPWGGPDVPGHVRVEVVAAGADGPVAVKEGVLHNQDELHFSLPAPATRFRVTVTVSPTFSPSHFGQGDERQLGAQPSFRLVG